MAPERGAFRGRWSPRVIVADIRVLAAKPAHAAVGAGGSTAAANRVRGRDEGTSTVAPRGCRSNSIKQYDGPIECMHVLLFLFLSSSHHASMHTKATSTLKTADNTRRFLYDAPHLAVSQLIHGRWPQQSRGYRDAVGRPGKESICKVTLLHALPPRFGNGGRRCRHPPAFRQILKVRNNVLQSQNISKWHKCQCRKAGGRVDHPLLALALEPGQHTLRPWYGVLQALHDDKFATPAVHSKHE